MIPLISSTSSQSRSSPVVEIVDVSEEQATDYLSVVMQKHIWRFFWSAAFGIAYICPQSSLCCKCNNITTLHYVQTCRTFQINMG